MAATVGAAVFCLVITLVVPVGALVALLVKNRRLAGAFVLGAAAFFISQVLIRLPLLGVVQQTVSYAVFSATNPLACTALVALSAGVFEEVARYLLLMPVVKRGSAIDLRMPIAFGLGHGGCEAILLVGVDCAALLAMPALLATVAPDQLVLGGLERLATMAAHAALTLVVYVGVTRRQARYLVAAIILHGLYDMLTILPALGMDALALEIVLLVLSAALLAGAVAWVRALQRKQSPTAAAKAIGN